MTGSSAATIKSGATKWTWPTTDGAAGTFLKTDGAGGLAFGAPGSVVREVPSGTINGSNTVFTLTGVPATAAHLGVFLDGLLVPASEYTYTTPGSVPTITFTTAPATGQTLDAFIFT